MELTAMFPGVLRGTSNSTQPPTDFVRFPYEDGLNNVTFRILDVHRLGILTTAGTEVRISLPNQRILWNWIS